LTVIACLVAATELKYRKTAARMRPKQTIHPFLKRNTLLKGALLSYLERDVAPLIVSYSSLQTS